MATKDYDGEAARFVSIEDAPKAKWFNRTRMATVGGVRKLFSYPASAMERPRLERPLDPVPVQSILRKAKGLTDGADVNENRADVDKNRVSALLHQVDAFEAISKGDLAGIRRAIDAGVSVDEKRHTDGVTLLTFACSHHAIPVVKTLLELGADPDLPSNCNMLPQDYAQNNTEIDALLWTARQRLANEKLANEKGESKADDEPIRSWNWRDLTGFVKEAELELPIGGMKFFRSRLKKSLGEEGAAEFERQLESTKYRALFEQLFAGESLGCAYLSADNKAFRSPMTLGKYEVGFSERRQHDIVERFKFLFETTDALLWQLLPDELFVQPPKRICEIGGAWGATIRHLTERFSPEVYQNYEIDKDYAQWATKRFGAIRMPVDGETLRGTESDSIDLVIANNVLIFVPPIKAWSYLREMRRVIKKNGIILFNAVLSDQQTELELDYCLNAYFPNRAIHILPSDIINRNFPEPQFKLVSIYNKEYCIYQRVH